MYKRQVYGPPFVYDRDRGRREAKLLDFENFVKMTYLSPWLHPVSYTHLDVYKRQLWHRRTSRPISLPSMGGVMSCRLAGSGGGVNVVLENTGRLKR